MATHQIKGMTFDVPDDWVDRTIIAFAGPKGDGPPEYVPNVVMTREPLNEGDSIRTHADRTLLEMAKLLEGFDILESRETTLAGLRAVQIRFRWTSGQGDMEQAMTMCESPAEPGDKGRFATIVTTSAHNKMAAATKPTFDAILASFRFPPRGAPPPGGSMPPSLPPPDPGLPDSPVFGIRRR